MPEKHRHDSARDFCAYMWPGSDGHAGEVRGVVWPRRRISWCITSLLSSSQQRRLRLVEQEDASSPVAFMAITPGRAMEDGGDFFAPAQGG